jgi:hypothetical protein
LTSVSSNNSFKAETGMTTSSNIRKNEKKKVNRKL